MYRELLEECVKKTHTGKLQGPCSENDIAEAEKVVGHTFPDDLRALLREVNGDNWFLLSCEQIIKNVEMNREYYSACFEPEEYLEKVDRHIFFATNGCGDHYCYRVFENGVVDTSAVYIWDHEDFETRYAAKNIKDAIIRYYNDEI